MNKKYILIGISATILLIIFLLSNKTVSNTIFLTILPADKYYMRVENKNIKKIKKEIKRNFDDNFKQFKKQTKLNNKASYKLKLEKNALRYILDSEEILKDKNLSSEKIIEFSVDKKMGKNKISYNINILYNNENIITAKLILDFNKNIIYVQVPDIVDRWFSYKTDNIKEVEVSLNALDNLKLDAKTINKLIDKYSFIILKYINKQNIKLDKKIIISIEEKKKEINKITLHFSNKEIQSLIKDITTEAKKDKELYNIFKSIGISKKKYNEILSDITFEKSNIELEIITYVNKKSEIIGREIKISNKKETKNILFYSIDDSYKLEYKDSDNDYEMIINNKEKKKKKSGEIKIINKTSKENKEIKIIYKDVYKENNVYNGTFTVNNILDNNSNIKVKLEENNNLQDFICEYNLDNHKIITFSILNSDLKQKNTSVPQKSIDVDKLMKDELMQYNLLLEVDYSKTVSKLENLAKDIMLDNIFNGLLSYTDVKYFNGKQTPMTLYQLGKSNKEYSKIFRKGYEKTIKGENPGLDKQLIEEK